MRVTGTAIKSRAKELSYALKAAQELKGIEKRQPILVFQMGKVGSSSVARVLEELEYGPILHVHALSQTGIDHAVSLQRKSISPGLPQHLVLSRALRRNLDAIQRPVRIITLTREPISRVVSFVFQDWKKKLPEMDASGSVDPGLVRERIIKILSGHNGNSDPGLWFEQELKGCFGIDVFSRPYDFDRGYAIYENDRAKVLLIRLEDLNRSMGSALSTFLGRDLHDVDSAGANLGEDKRYAAALAEAKETLDVPDDVLAKVVGTRYFKHFYESDREKVIRRWTRHRHDPAQV